MIASASSPRRSFSLGHRVAGDDGGQRLIADPQPDLSHQAVSADFLDETAQPVASAQRDDEPGGASGVLREGLGGGRLARQQAVDLRLRQPMVAAGGLRRADACPGRSTASAWNSRCPAASAAARTVSSDMVKNSPPTRRRSYRGYRAARVRLDHQPDVRSGTQAQLVAATAASGALRAARRHRRPTA